MTTPPYAHAYDQATGPFIKADVLSVFDVQGNRHIFDTEYRPLDLYTLRHSVPSAFTEAWIDVRDTFTLPYVALDNVSDATKFQIAQRVLDKIDEDYEEALQEEYTSPPTVVIAIPQRAGEGTHEDELVVLQAPERAPFGVPMEDWLPATAREGLGLHDCMYITDHSGRSGNISGTDKAGSPRHYRLIVKRLTLAD